MGVVVRRYIDFLILLIPTPLVSVLFYSSIPTFCSFFKCFSFLLEECQIAIFYFARCGRKLALYNTYSIGNQP